MSGIGTISARPGRTVSMRGRRSLFEACLLDRGWGNATIFAGECEERKIPRKPVEVPKFKNQREEADWWASTPLAHLREAEVKGRRRLGIKPSGSSLVARLNAQKCHQIAIRLAVADIEQARRLAGRKGIGYRTLLKAIVQQAVPVGAMRGPQLGLSLWHTAQC